MASAIWPPKSLDPWEGISIINIITAPLTLAFSTKTRISNSYPLLLLLLLHRIFVSDRIRSDLCHVTTTTSTGDPWHKLYSALCGAILGIGGGWNGDDDDDDYEKPFNDFSHHVEGVESLVWLPLRRQRSIQTMRPQASVILPIKVAPQKIYSWPQQEEADGLSKVAPVDASRLVAVMIQPFLPLNQKPHLVL